MNNGKKTKGVMLFLVIAVILMTVGFAAYSSTLNITGNVTVKGNPWNVHYIANQITETTGTNAVTASAKSVTNTDFTFTVTLNKPGDFYEATITVQNEGTILAYLNSVTMSTLTAAQQNYLSYSITYNNGTPYTATTTGITGISLAAGGTHPVKVRVEYLEPANQSQLPTEDVTVTVTGSLNYSSQATS